MIKVPPLGLLIVMLALGSAKAQTPTGTIAGAVTDQTGAALTGASLDIVNRDTGQTRTLTTSVDGIYSAAALPPGVYRISVEAAGFKRLERTASVEAGTTTTVDMTLLVGEVTESVAVAATVPLIRHDHHQVGGVVTREQIERVPLNGRNFLELAKFQPGVTTPARLSDGRVFVPSLGGGLPTIPRIGNTRVTVDGASISTPGTVGVLLQISQDAVQEFQMSTVNFDPTISLTSNGAINIVTRSGGNGYHGSGFYFHRDHHLAAYPALRRDPTNHDPFFERRQFGVHVGGPVRRDRAFFFGNYEGVDQTSVTSIQPAGELAPLGGIFPSPYGGNQFNIRLDVQLHPRHNVFSRYTHDRNSTFALLGPTSLPSGWSRRVNQADQGMVGITSLLSARLVNDVRFAYFSTPVDITPATSDDCGNCFGLGKPRTTIQNAQGSALAFGVAGGSSSTGRRYQVTESLVWQKGRHTVRAGFDWEHNESRAFMLIPRAGEITVFSPAEVLQQAPEIPLPASFVTVEDILQLPLRTVSVTVGSGTVGWPGFSERRVTDLYRLYFGDTWRANSRVTVNYGLGWSYEPNALPNDLTKPALLVPLLGPDGLQPPEAGTGNFSPTVGFAWTATGDGKTVVRGGAGRYFDQLASTNAVNLISERHALSPLGTGSLTRTGANLLYQGRPLQFLTPTGFTGAQALQVLPAIRADLVRMLNPGNRDLSVRNLDSTKEGENLYDPFYTTPYALHASLGLQREVAAGLVVSADLAWKRFVHTFINGIDYNRWDSVAGPVIPKCTEAQLEDVRALCSNGNMYFDTTIGRARYLGLLVRVEKRFSRRTQLLGSYALASFRGTNGTGTGTSEAPGPGARTFGFNNDNWFENYGPLPTDHRHILNLSGSVELPWRLQLAANISAHSAAPFAPYIAGVDVNGDGTMNDLLPGTTINQFGRGLSEQDLVRLVNDYNQQFAGGPTPAGRLPHVALPERYSFNDGFFTQDLRLAWTSNPGLRGASVAVFVEIFNVLNTSNLVGFSANLRSPNTFGQPGSRVSQVFGSGGPRAFQLGARLTF
jgi:hypothetical protein